VKIGAANAPCAVRDFLNRAKRFATGSDGGRGPVQATECALPPPTHTHTCKRVGGLEQEMHVWVGVLRFAANPAPTAGEGSRSFT
jgi:hypothetical protein